MSSQTRPGGIPFPQASEQGGTTSSKSKRSAQQSTMGQETFATPEVPVRRGARPSSQDGPSDDGANGASGPAKRRGHKTSNSSSSSGSTAGTEGLPSIRNLLSSIDSDERAPSPKSMSRRPLPSSSQGPESHLANRMQAFGQGGRGPFRPPEQQGTSSHWRNSQSWDLKSSMRPSSPTRRPPLAPSAYAHAHFSPSGSRAGLFGAAPSREDGAQHGKNSRSRASHLSLHSSDYGRGQQNAPDSQAAERSREDDGSSGTRAADMDEDGQGHDGERESAAVRRRHTLGALDEPPRLRADGAEVSMAEDKDMATTPRAPYHHKLLSPIHRIPESPTTPTASNIAARTNHPEGQRPQHSRSGSDMALPPNAHPLYLQGGMHVSGSMPSLVSHQASPMKPGARKSSFEDGREGGPAWSGHGAYNGSETLTSPHSSVWHSRSSTLDSIDTASSLGMRSGSSMAAPRGGSHMHSHHHSLSSSSVSSMGMRRPPVEEFPRTPTHARHDYNRNWRFPANQGTPREGLPPPGMVGEGGTPTGPGVHASPFANMSLSSPSDPRTNAPPYYPRQHPYDSPQHRPRAQTLSYNDRPIAPLPSHAVHGSPHHSPAYHAPTRSLSSHSVSSLPQRVSSMQLEHWNSPSVVDFQSPSSVAGRSPTGTVIVSAKAGAGSGSSTNKYTCTWCGKRFSRPSSLKIHYHSHTGEKPYTCDEPGCGRNFSVQSNLRRHQKSHATFSERIGDEGELRRSGSLHSRHASDASHSTASFGSQRRHSGTLGQPWGSPISSSHNRAPFLAAQNRRPSISSTTAGEDEEEEEYELEEEEAARSLGSLKTRRFEYAPEDKGAPARYEPRHETGSSDGAAADDADETMQDIRHEKEAPAQSAA